jgi:NTP pyrophosphatase (non-canonical NTP hydrolase)
VNDIFDFEQLQFEQRNWQDQNFPNAGRHECFYGVVEEIGELSHALLKMDQGIRGTQQEHMAEVKDAIGDIIIYLAGLSNKRGINLQEAVETAWDEVKQRNWVKYPKTGTPEESIRLAD